MTSLVLGDPTKFSRCRLSLAQISVVLSELKNVKSVAQAHIHLAYSRRSVFDIQTNAASILEQATHYSSGMTKTVRQSQFPDIDQHLFQLVQMA